MATILRRKDKKGRTLRAVQTRLPNGSRRTIGLGRATEKQAGKVQAQIEHLVKAKITGFAPDDETLRWVASLSPQLRRKLEEFELIASSASAGQGLGRLADFIDFYIDRRTDVKPLTKVKYQAGRTKLIEYFGEDKPIALITEFDAEDWQRTLRDRGYAENTVRKHTATAKLFFEAARKKRLIENNPFNSLKASIRPNAERFHFVSREVAAQILEACPDAEWRLIFALSRFGGLRCPSEHLALRWDRIHWDSNRMEVLSPKTEHHEGHGSRMVPIFDELRTHLESAFDAAEPGTEFVINRYRLPNTNLRTQFLRIIRNAGVEAWPKLFQNLRSTRQTELEELFPSHVVCSWIGNSERVAAKHYLQVTEDHFARAANALSNRPEGEQKPRKTLKNGRAATH